MAHDFAKKRQTKTSGKRNASKKRTTQGTDVSGHWSWFFSGLFAGLLFAFVIYLGVVKPAGLENLQAQMAEPELAAEPALEEDPGLKLNFYDYLQENEVTVDVIPVDILPKEQPLASTETNTDNTNQASNYLLHAGSFQVRLNAESLQAKIILLNLNAAIIPTVVNGRNWHRVRVGPFNGRSKAEDAKKVLSSNGVDTKILLMK